MFQRANAAFGAVGIQRIPAAILRERLRRADTRRACTEHLFYRFILADHNVVLLQRLRQRQTQHVFYIAIHQPGAIQLAQNTQYAACAVDVFHVVFLRTWRDFTQLWNLAGKLVDIAHSEVDFRFLRRRQQV